MSEPRTPSLAQRLVRESVSQLAGVLDGIGSLIFPPNCAVCGVGIPNTRHSICPRCASKVVLTGRDYCSGCGAIKPATTGVTNTCLTCERPGIEFNLQGVSAAGDYDGVLRQCVLRLKFSGERGLAEPLARWMAEVLSHRSYKAHLIVPVPLSESRLWERGYNQAEEIALALGDVLDLPVYPDALRRAKHTIAQTTLSTATERKQNMKGAFRPGEEAGAIRNRRVLLVDDVSTTGATLSAAAVAIRKLGAKSVMGVLAARTPFQSVYEVGKSAPLKKPKL